MFSHEKRLQAERERKERRRTERQAGKEETNNFAHDSVKLDVI